MIGSSQGSLANREYQPSLLSAGKTGRSFGPVVRTASAASLRVNEYVGCFLGEDWQGWQA